MNEATKAFERENKQDPRAALERCILGTMMLDGAGPQCQADAQEIGLVGEMLGPVRRKVWAALVDRHDGHIEAALRLAEGDRAEVFRCMREASIPGALFRSRVSLLVRMHVIGKARSGSHSVAAEQWSDVDALREAVGSRVLDPLVAIAALDGDTDDSIAAALAESATGGEQIASLACAPGFDGLRRGRVVVIGARPKHGKSILGLQIAASAAHKRPALLVSLEMARGEQAKRLRRQGGDDVAGLMLDIVTHAKAPTIEALHRLATAKKLKHGDLALVVLDYVQIARCEGEAQMADWQRVTKISRDCKLIAGSLDCCVVVLSQLKQSSEGREWPRSSDLAQADALQRDADHVLLLHRPHMGGEDRSKRNEGILIHDVSRHGSGGVDRVRFDDQTLRFVSVYG
tara:strand:- start:1190 stop:2395 length:1206 start_codon:yes stop_codon:yes gene_type:complete